jgi:hypothetical protein
MKLVLMTYYVGIHHDVMEILGDLGICTYARWREIEGRISCGEPREGTHVWPGTNSALMVVVDDTVAETLVRRLESANESKQDEGVDAYVLDVARTVTAGPPKAA